MAGLCVPPLKMHSLSVCRSLSLSLLHTCTHWHAYVVSGSVVQRAIVAVVMWISRTHMLAKRRATNTLPMTLEEQARWQQASPLEKSLRHYVSTGK